MKRIEFIIWAGKQGWKHGQKYLNKAYSYFFDKGKIPDPNVILQKAKNYTSPRFLADQAKVKPIKVPEQTKNILNIKSTLEGRPVKVVPERPFKGWTPRVIKGGKKADGGRIDKALPTRSRDI
jgi:hypothetical protein